MPLAAADIKRAVFHPIRTIEAKTADVRAAWRRKLVLWVLAGLSSTFFSTLLIALPGSLKWSALVLYLMGPLMGNTAGAGLLHRGFNRAKRERETDAKIASQAAEIEQLRENSNGEMVEQVAISQRRELQFACIRQELVNEHIARMQFILGDTLETDEYWMARMDALSGDRQFVTAQVNHFQRILGARKKVVTISVNPKADLLQRLLIDISYLKTELDYISEYISDYQKARNLCPEDKCACVDEELFYLVERCRVRQEELEDLRIVHNRVKNDGIDPSNYEFVRSLGIGGMGVALLFYSVALRQFVVVKVHTGECTPEALARFEREIKSLMALQHDNVARIYSAGVDKKEDIDHPPEDGGMSPATFVSRALREVERRMRDAEDKQPSDQRVLDNLTLRLYQKDNSRYHYDFNYYVMELIRGGDLGDEIWALGQKNLRMSSWRAYSYLWQILNAIECYSKRMVMKTAFLNLGQTGGRWWEELSRGGLIRVFVTRHGEENAIVEADIKTIKQAIDATSQREPELLGTQGEILKIFDNLPQSIIHRDIKPENIIPRREIGLVKVIDFGIAKALRAESIAGTQATRGLTQVGQLLVTLQYAPLEQLLGQNIDITADLYALAAIAYELLTSNMLFPESDYQQALSARRDDNKIKNNVIRAFAYRMDVDGVRVQGNIVDQKYYALTEAFCRMLIRMLAVYPKSTREHIQLLDRPTIDEVKAVLEPLVKYAAWKVGRRETPN